MAVSALATCTLRRLLIVINLAAAGSIRLPVRQQEIGHRVCRTAAHDNSEIFSEATQIASASSHHMADIAKGIN